VVGLRGKASGDVYRRRSPYGVPGDRLWVKEKCWIAPKRFGDPDLNNCKDPDGDGRVVGYSASMDGDSVRCAKDYGVRESPSIYMPRWASRITLEITNVRVERAQAISEADSIAEGMNQECCAGVFDRAARKTTLRDVAWLETESGDWASENYYCYQCAQKLKKKKHRLCGDGGCAIESDGPAFCDQCYAPILMSLTQYGIERELRLEEDPDGKDPKYFPVNDADARVVHMIADGFGDLQDKHLGRLAQIGYATYWDSINGTKYPWSSDPWVWVIEFKVL
jgi:hypothetical protein